MASKLKLDSLFSLWLAMPESHRLVRTGEADFWAQNSLHCLYSRNKKKLSGCCHTAFDCCRCRSC